MGLIDLKTDLKSLRYGKDTLGGGNSGQPYIQSPIPDSFNNLGANEDFILRGGISAAKDSITDVKRLGKMFTDLKSPNGLIFIAKQQLLSRTAVRTQTSGILNEGIYSPLNTLAEAGLVAFGNHLNKQGINPFASTGAYAAGINNEHLYNVKIKSTQPNNENRLVLLYSGSFVENKSYDINGLKLNNGQNVMVYNGGPGSQLGIGNTNIRFADQRTGLNNRLAKLSGADKNYFYGKYTSKNNPDSLRYYKNLYLNQKNLGVNGVSGIYTKLTSEGFSELYNYEGVLAGGYYNFNVYNTGSDWPKNNLLINTQNTYTYNQQDIINPYEIVKINKDDPTTTSKKQGSIASPKIQDFRAILRDKAKSNPQPGFESAVLAGQLSTSLPYSGEGAQNFEQRVNIGNPGQRGNNNYSDYAKGVLNKLGSSAYGSQNVYKLGPTKENPNGTLLGTTTLGLDKINSLPIYRSEAVAQDPIVNDFVKFRIAVIDNDSPNFKTFMHFRAFLGPISDSYSADWNGFNYLGRGEKFYTYGGFDRKISLSWTVAAQSKEELIPMYKKLNYLASTLAPDYSPKGYMRGNLVQLTIGGYLYEQPGFITGLTYEMGEDSPWEIGIGTTETPNDSSVKELTQIIRVTGFSFTPIHNFVPRKQQLTFTNKNTPGSVNDDTGFVQSYDNERFIALSNGINNNYDN
jgi:hypothetical protein